MAYPDPSSPCPTCGILPTTPPPPPPPDAWAQLTDEEREAVGEWLSGGKVLPSNAAILAGLARLGLVR